MGRFGVLLATPDGWPQEASFTKHFHELAFQGEDYMWCGGGYCHFFTLKELEGLFNKNVTILERVGLEGFNVSERVTNNFAKKYPKAWKNWLDVHYKLCTHPSVADLSGHIMIIVKKKYEN